MIQCATHPEGDNAAAFEESKVSPSFGVPSKFLVLQ